MPCNKSTTSLAGDKPNAAHDGLLPRDDVDLNLWENLEC